jgi:hypothetical protein
MLALVRHFKKNHKDTKTQRFFLFLCVLCVFVVSDARAQSTVVDQLAATVNGEAITQSDIIWGLALDSNVAELKEDSQDMTEMLNQLIDQSLLFDEAEHLPNLEPTPDEVNSAIGDLIRRFPSEAGFYQRIGRVGLTAEMLQSIMRRRLQILKYIDFRFRSFAIITEDEIQRYYRETLQPQLRARGLTPPEQPADQERYMIESILVEDRIDRETERFLESARQQADIVVYVRF